MKTYDLSGTWQCAVPVQARITLPGTLDENGVGFPDMKANPWHPDEVSNAELITKNGPIATRLTRRFTYEGAAVFSRALHIVPSAGKRIFLECERARQLSLRVNGADVPHVLPASLSAPHVFEVTGRLTGDDVLELTSDNSYPGWPRSDIVYSSAATDETQTNWNGVLGFIRLREEEPTFIQAVRVYPHGGAIDVLIEVSAVHLWSGVVCVQSDALAEQKVNQAQGGAGITTVRLRSLPLRPDVRRWDEGEGRLYAVSARLGMSEKTVSFGVRDFVAKDGRLTLNGRNIFLRGEANCAVFPETGHPPMDAPSWRRILSVYRGYGVNCVRFHSHCPPEAAFAAADEMGMLMQPELSHWNPKDAFSTPQSRAYYAAELESILAALANHPSFVMLTLGNELHADEEGHAFMAQLLDYAREIDPTRLYAEGSNNHYGQRRIDGASDFYTSFSYGAHDLRATSSPMTGWLNERYPDLRTDYGTAMRAIRARSEIPVFSFEVGQYEILPDFDELDAFHGVTDPANLRLIQRKVDERGLTPRWKEYVRATGELALLCYRAEVEAALRTEGLSGISLLGLQDFPGQGTALVGMLNSHLTPKPYDFAQPGRFAAFFAPTLPLVLLERLTYTCGETLEARVRVAHYGKETLRGTPAWKLEGNGFLVEGKLPFVCAASGGLTDLGTLRVPLESPKRASRLSLTVRIGAYSNTYSIWVYPDETPVCPPGVYECRSLDDGALAALRRGGVVYLAPDSTREALPRSIKGQFSTDFWSVGTFPAQEGGMGQLIDAAHPVFSGFPTDTHTDWQWWPMANQRAVILPRPMEAIVTLMDSYAYLRPMAQLLECRCGEGRLLLSTLGLHDLMRYPEARALQSSIYRYLASNAFLPRQRISPDEIRSLVTTKRTCRRIAFLG